MMRPILPAKYLNLFGLFMALVICTLSNSVLAAPEPVTSLVQENFSIIKINVEGNKLISDGRINKITERFVGSNKSVKDIEQLQEAILDQYKAAGYSLVSVAIFDIKDAPGHYKVTVKEDVLRNIKVTGNKYLQEQSIRAALPALKTGTSINIRNLDRQVLAANENSSRIISVALQTIDVGVFDAEVTVIEGRRFTHTFSVDNTGNRDSEPLRYSYRFIHNGLGWNQDATGAFIYTRSSSRSLEQYLFYYSQPLTGKDQSISFLAAKSNSDSGLSQTGYGDFNVNGAGQFYSLHYMRTLYRTSQTKLALDLGLDFRQSVDNTSIFGIDVGPDVNAKPVSIGLNYSWRGKQDFFTAHIAYVRNISGGYLNDNDAYYIVRPEAKADFQLWRGNLNYVYRFKNGWALNNRIDWQYTTEPLIPDEQFGLGGARSVRGFEERELSGDKGVSARMELYTPLLGKSVRLLAFYDVGQVWYFDFFGDLGRPTTISSTGIGLRWNINRIFSFSADYAYVLKGYITPDHDWRLHFELSATF